MRLNNLELRRIEYDKWEIVKWFDNPYYCKEGEYIKAGESYFKEDNPHVNVHESCFKNTESCFTIVFFENGVPDFVGNRVMDEIKSITNMKNFLYLLRKGVRKSLNKKI